MIDREQVKALVKDELRRRLSVAASAPHPALAEILLEGPQRCLDVLDFPEERPCVIEPDRPCYNSGYCKKLGY